jgi:hypothetical protein
MATAANKRISARREGLVRMLFGDTAMARSAASSFTDIEDWEAIFHQSEEWSVVGQLVDRIARLELQVPDEPTKKFKRLAIATYARSASRAAKGVKALAHLEQLGVRAVAFKGVASMARLYAKPGERSIKDIDLLIDERDLAAAVAGLGEVEFRPIEGQGFDELNGLIEYLPNFSGNKAIVLSDRAGLEIDLHWSVGLEALPSHELIARSGSHSLFGSTLRMVNVADALVLTVRHSIRENLAVDSICRDLYDILQTFSMEAEAGTLHETLAAASQSGGVLPLLALAGVLHRLAATHHALTQAFEWLSLNATPSERKEAASLERIFFHQVTNGRLEKDLVYLTHTTPLRQMMNGALKNWRGYRSLMLSMEDKLEGKPMPILERIMNFVYAAKNVGPGHLRSLRTLARLRFDTARRGASSQRG